jgi:transposase
MQKKAAIELVVGMGLCKRSRACRVLEVNRSTVYYRRRISAEKLAQEGLVEEVSREWPSLGYEKVTTILHNEHGVRVNRKRVSRIRRERGLTASRGGPKCQPSL